MSAQAPRRLGRPPRTTRDEVAKAALRLFVEHGFEQTTLEDVAACVGVSRRTILRYFRSKNDIVWGSFDEQLESLRARFAAADPGEPLMDVIRSAVVAFNDYGESVLPELRDRMTLITGVPALQGHAMIRYADWCAVIAEFVAQRLDRLPEDQVPQLIANVALATAMTTYRHWVVSPQADLLEDLDRAFRLVAAGF